MKQQKMMNRSNKFANQRIELWATENSFLFNTADLLERESPILVRKNHNQIDTEQFIYVLKILINNKSYGNNAIHHSNHMTYKIHSLSGRLGTLRFLPWHRIFLFELEEMMQAFSPGISIPYWDWTRDREIPNWLKDYTPNVPY